VKTGIQSFLSVSGLPPEFIRPRRAGVTTEETFYETVKKDEFVKSPI
jgi:hypothetical protein